MSVELFNSNVFFTSQNVKADLERCQRRKKMCAHEVGKRQFRVRCSGKHRTSGIEIRNALPGEIIVAEKSAAVCITLQRLAEQERIERVRVQLRADGGGKLCEQSSPCVNVAGAVVAVNHRNRRAVRRCDHVDFPVNAKQLVHDDHGKVGCTGRDVAGPDAHRVGRSHARSGVALRRAERDAGLQIAARVEQLCTFLRQPTSVCTGR